MKRSVTWAIKRRDDGAWYCESVGQSVFFVRERRAACRFSTRKEAKELRDACMVPGTAVVVRITSGPDPSYFHTGDVWEWVDREEAERNGAEVGGQVFVLATSTSHRSATVSFVQGTLVKAECWNQSDTLGLRLVLRGGMAVKP